MIKLIFFKSIYYTYLSFSFGFENKKNMKNRIKLASNEFEIQYDQNWTLGSRHNEHVKL